ncbi:IQ domain-containing protein C [Cheilinus undulatus]|uniref:IQ domain-containing protein C n=1 Tax=Cheilinus undulatus TaxID=241271 RepID=UPI001BD4550C|nr:IQ domain-containing protein C [Cheilinus undulatus]
MERSQWERKLTCFQARARGYLVRCEVHRAREDFEDIVKDIDGGLTHLEWRETLVIPTPHFTDTDESFLQVCKAASRPSNPGLNISTSPLRLSSSSPLSKERHQHVLLEKIEAERDGSQTKEQESLTNDCFLSCSVREDRVGQRQTTERDRDGEEMKSTSNSTTVWSSLELDENGSESKKGTQRYCSVQDVPCTPEALRLHRNTLTMELLWLQQAIGSRKKYLSLKNRLSMS